MDANLATVVGHQFITLSIHLCVRHYGCEIQRRAGLSASAETCRFSHVCSAFKIQSHELYYSSVTVLTGYTSATSLSSCEMADTVLVGFPSLQSLTHRSGTLSYLSERLHPYVSSRTLRSSSSASLYVPRTNLHFVSRSFHNIAAPPV